MTTLDQLLDAVNALTIKVDALIAARPAITKTPCKGTTAKGTPCRNRCLPDSEFCRMHHDRPPPVPKPPREKKTKTKTKKPVPVHTHDDPGTSCQLCQSHGDVTVPEMPEDAFEPVDSDLTSRLRELLRGGETTWADENEEEGLPDLPEEFIRQ